MIKPIRLFCFTLFFFATALDRVSAVQPIFTVLLHNVWNDYNSKPTAINATRFQQAFTTWKKDFPTDEQRRTTSEWVSKNTTGLEKQLVKGDADAVAVFQTLASDNIGYPGLIDMWERVAQKNPATAYALEVDIDSARCSIPNEVFSIYLRRLPILSDDVAAQSLWIVVKDKLPIRLNTQWDEASPIHFLKAPLKNSVCEKTPAISITKDQALILYDHEEGAGGKPLSALVYDSLKHKVIANTEHIGMDFYDAPVKRLDRGLSVKVAYELAKHADAVATTRYFTIEFKDGKLTSGWDPDSKAEAASK